MALDRVDLPPASDVLAPDPLGEPEKSAEAVSTPGEPGRFSGALHFLRRNLPPVLVLVGLIVLWAAVVAFGHLASYELPSPWSVVVSAVDTNRAELISALGTTLTEIVIGFLIAVAVGFVLSLVLVASRPFRLGIYPLLIASQTIPVLAIAPLMIIWFGFGILPKVLVIVLFGFFPVVLNLLTGMNSVERDAVFLMRMLGAGKYKIIWRLRLPAAMPYFFVGVKQAAVYSAIGAVAGEWVGAQRGLGPLMIGANSSLQTNVVFAAIFYLSAVAIVLFLLVTIIEHFAIPWHTLQKKAARDGLSFD
jgi:ABC-type nitrate/sulfonate/bicarbonate transport system permease component